jgi:hypothetical protein
MACFWLAFKADAYSIDGNIFWTERNFKIFAPEVSPSPKPNSPAETAAPQNKFGFCEGCPPSTNEILLSCMGFALLICSLFFSAQKPRNRDE